jgi:uncharacterized protein YdhG (YjbR/CyaY superfamily)
MKTKQKSAKSTTAKQKRYEGFTDEEKAAMVSRVGEMKAEAGRGSRAAKEDGEGEVLAKIAGMQKSDRAMAERVHAVIKSSAPALSPKTWYGMPAYARDGKIVVFFQPAQKFKTRYATLGFNDPAHLDDGTIWPTAYAVLEVTPAVEAKIAALVKKAAR